jgi:hypothetical protein
VYPWHTRNPRMVAWLYIHGVYPAVMEQVEGSERYNFYYTTRPTELIDAFIDGQANPYHTYLNAYFDALGQAKDAFKGGLTSVPFVAA